VAVIHIAGVRCDPCGAMRWTPELTIGILNFSVLKFKKKA